MHTIQAILSSCVAGDECLLNSVARGQEFVLDTQGQDAPVQCFFTAGSRLLQQ